MSEAFQKDQNKYLFVTGKSSHSGSEPEDSVIIKARFYTLREGYGYFGKVRKLQQPQINTFCYVKKLHGGLFPPPSRNRVKYLFLITTFHRTMQTQKF